MRIVSLRVMVDSNLGMVTNDMTSKSRLENVMIVSSNIIGKDQVQYTGGVVGYQSAASIYNIMIVSSNITGGKESIDVGGIVGFISRSKIKKVYVVSVIVSQFGLDGYNGQDNHVGGVAGYGYGTDIQSVTVMDSIVHGSGVKRGGVVGLSDSDLLTDVNVIRTTISGFGSGNVYVGGVCGGVYNSDIQKATVSSATIIAPQYGKIVYLGGGVGDFFGKTIADLTVIDTVITVGARKIIAGTRESIHVGGSVGFLSGTKGSRFMVINTTINIEGNVQKGDVGLMAGNMQTNSSSVYILVSNSLININELNDIYVGSGAGVMSESSIANFTISNSILLFDGDGNIGSCIGSNKGGNNKCDFNEAIKSILP
ncbi:MAG: hypothetical protein QS748_14670 [Candidatus Endonucleobacter bathymodioli]|uniref:Uncharacterized protein n=1 Tax=Candidatus Endonucleibacter bathymodioli TaxID=539814 RepID=A0AA90NPC8_9GAMM|nr:hypothetical protein [Candidatus Endonucleobacter bathymodioli]